VFAEEVEQAGWFAVRVCDCEGDAVLFGGVAGGGDGAVPAAVHEVEVGQIDDDRQTGTDSDSDSERSGCVRIAVEIEFTSEVNGLRIETDKSGRGEPLHSGRVVPAWFDQYGLRHWCLLVAHMLGGGFGGLDDTPQELLARDGDDPETTRITARIHRMNTM
jgi:hypothetical protein